MSSEQLSSERQALESICQGAEKLVRQKQFAQALDMLIGIERHSQQSLYLKAVCLRYLRRFELALVELQQLIALTPDYGRAYQEAGHCYLALQQWDEAKAHFYQGVNFNPALLASWQQLGVLAKRLNDESLLEQVKNHLGYFADLPDVLISVTSMYHEGKLYKAEQLCRQFLQRHKHHPEGMRLLANIAAKLQILDDAEFLLDSVLNLTPTHKMARFDYIAVLHKKQKFDLAFNQAKTLLDSEPTNPGYINCFANQCAASGLYEQAIELYGQVEQQLPQSEGVPLSRGHAHKAIGEQQQAIDAYCKAAAIKPDFGDAYWSLANLKTYRFDEQQLTTMQALEKQNSLLPIDRIHLCFALGKAFEDGKQYELSFDYYQKGNQLKSAQLDYSAQRMQQAFDSQKAFFRVANQQQLARASLTKAPTPIFIVGLPRAGSTLIEQILASHSMVDGTIELQHIMALAHRLDGRRKKDQQGQYPQILAQLSDEQLSEFAAEYIEQSQVHRNDAPFFTDKMPNNFRHIGLIKAIFPHAKIIDARRDGMSCCFSGYKQLFAEGQEFSYDLEDIGHYYRGYVDLMDHWQSVFTDDILTVHYQSVVDDIEGQVAGLLAFIGLPFERQCIDFHQTKRAVRTASSEQVRQPIYRSGLAPWQPYENQLAPLKALLGELA